MGHLQHYRREICKSWKAYNCTEYEEAVRDTSLWKLRKQVVENSLNTLRILDLSKQ